MITLGLSATPAGDPDPLPLAAGELVRIAVDVLGVQPDQVEQLLHPPPPAALGHDVGVDLERLADDVADGLPRVQRGVRILEDDLDVATQLAHRGTLLGVDVDSVEGQLAAGRLLQPHQHPAEGRLAAAGLAHDAQGLALVELEGDPVDRLDMADRAPQHARP